MKALKVVSLAMVCMAMVLVSCSGDDGEQGPQGIAGVDGVDGQDGVDGVDGNANVQQFSYNLEVFTNYGNLQFDLLNIVNQPENFAFLYYIVDNNGLVYSIPGPIYNLYYTSVYSDVISGGNTLFIDFYNSSDDTPAVVPGGTFTQVIVVAIEKTSLANKNGNADIMAELKSAGVDTSDYHAVAAYFGLE